MGVQASGDNLSVSGDRQMLRRMLRNLLENAAKHAGTEGLEVVMQKEGDRVRIEVRDRGPGIPDEEKERVFEPFYRPAHHREGRDGGVGLGLGLVRQIAAFHGGTATCVDREGGGTSFVIELPGVTGDPAAPPGE
jgi:signal transduction histidine kinase